MNSDKTEPAVKLTKDGSTTLFSSLFNQYYHNPNGAVAESRHVFFETTNLAGLLRSDKPLTIFETGFGTGLNLVLCLDYIRQSLRKIPVTFKSVEAYPIKAQTARDLSFGSESFLNKQVPVLAEIFDGLKPGMNQAGINPLLKLELFWGKFEDTPDFSENHIADKNLASFILHDPFSPDVNPGLWTPDVFKQLYQISTSDAILATYCAATSARAAMAVANWNVARARGALGKREMTIASKSAEKLLTFKRLNENRLKERFEKGDFG
ncbi:MAG: hypothetical protein EA391_07355 [Balneolaceae bacterium]|nr:MAG: hypothetical protein EA391_07355 [Balneolaceae bacterium]